VTFRRAALAAFLIASLAALAGPSSALAGFAQMNGNTPDYNDNNGNDNNNAVIDVDLSTGRIRIRDVGASGMGANIPCTVDAPDTVSCPSAGVPLITVSLQSGNDRMTVLAPFPVSIGGGNGNDTIGGGTAPDNLRGGPGFDTITGGGGDDTIVGDDPLGQLVQSPGADTLDGGPGNDNVDGGAGNDAMVAGGDGADQVSGGDGNDTEQGGSGDDTMEATQGERGGNDIIDAGDGNDTLQGGNGSNGADKMNGGSGTDKAVYSDRANAVAVSLDNQANDGEPGEADDVEADVENVDGGQGGDTIVGDGSANALNGAGGNDSLDGGAGADTLTGGDGVDLANFASRTHDLKIKLDGESNDGESGEGDDVDTENVTAGAGDDDLEGNAQNNALAGGAGDDDTRGGDGNDSMDGGSGENYEDGGDGADSFAGGTSGDVFRSRDGVADTLTCSGDDFVVADGNDTVTGCARVDLDTTSHTPVLAQSLVVRPIKGSLPDMSPKGISRLVPLRDTINLPFGSVLDSRDGDVKITSSGGSGKAKSSATVLGKIASATISDALFQIKQAKAKVAKTELILKGGDFTSECKGSSSRSSGRSAAQAAASKHTVRRLFGKGKGRFRTRGRYSAATVRGTTWTVRDRCDGTLTSVKKGRVSVFDFGRKKTIFVRSGHSYLARATRAALKNQK
jgi:Ca2+-binding RTX toxin-like protein